MTSEIKFSSGNSTRFDYNISYHSSGRPSIESNSIKIEESDHSLSKSQSFSESNLQESKSFTDLQGLLNSTNYISMHLNNLSHALSKPRIESPRSLPNLSYRNDIQSQSPFLGMDQSSIFPMTHSKTLGQSVLHYPSSIDQSAAKIQLLNRSLLCQGTTTRFHSQSLSSIPNNYECLPRPQLQKPSFLQSTIQQQLASPFANLQCQFSGLNQMGNANHSQIPVGNGYQAQNVIKKNQQKFIEHHQHQREFQQRHLQSKMEALQYLEKQLEETKKKKKKKRGQSSRNKLMAEDSGLVQAKSLSEFSELYLEPTGSAPSKMVQESRTSPNSIQRDGIDIEEDLHKNQTKQMEISSVTSIEEEIATTIPSSKGVSQRESLNSQFEGLTIKVLDSSILSQKSIYVLIGFRLIEE